MKSTLQPTARRKLRKRLVAKFITISLTAVLFASFSNATYAWFTSSVDPIKTDVTTARVLVELTGAPSATVPKALPDQPVTLTSLTITNKSTREIVLEVSLDVDGYLKMLEYHDFTGTGPMAPNTGNLLLGNQNAAYLYSNAGLTVQDHYANLVTSTVRMFYGPVSPDRTWPANTWRTLYEKASDHLLDTGSLRADGTIYLLVDDSITSGAVYTVNPPIPKLMAGSAHFNAVRKYFTALLAEGAITKFAEAAGGSSSSVRWDAADNIVYEDTAKGIAIYYDDTPATSSKFYVFLEAPAAGVLSVDYDLTGAGAKIPADLGGGVGPAYRLPSGYWGYPGLGSLDTTLTYNTNHENSAGDAAAATRLNEQGAMFKISLGAKAVQGTKAAITDVFGLDVANGFGTRLSGS